jgi:hypothetical protein
MCLKIEFLDQLTPFQDRTMFLILCGLARVKALTKMASLPFLFFDHRARL